MTAGSLVIVFIESIISVYLRISWGMSGKARVKKLVW